MDISLRRVSRLLAATWMMVASAAMLSTGGGTAQAQTLVFSFEFFLDGFTPNGGGITLGDSTVGVTEGVTSMQVDVVSGATFVGALTQLLPPEIGDPPGLDYVLFDLTIEEEFTDGFAVVGITMFGHSQPDYPGGQQFGLQVQFLDDEQPIDGLAPGTYRDMRIDLTSALHPLTFQAGQSFNDIFGTEGSGPNDLLPSGFQFYFNKTGSPASHALRVYIDNVRVGMSPSGDFDGDGNYDCDDINALSTAIASGSTNPSFDMNGDGQITTADITDAGNGWLAVGGANNPAQTGGRPFLNGDANLSGGVDGSDFGIWNTNKFTVGSAWCRGDFNASGAIDGSDFGIWNGNKFTSSDAATVPEPVGTRQLLACFIMAWRVSARRRG